MSYILYSADEWNNFFNRYLSLNFKMRTEFEDQTDYINQM